MSDDRTLEDVVVDYLQNHPDFLEQRPDALVNLDLTHRSGEAVSLIERQVEMLRIRNAELEFVGTVFEDDTLYEYDLNGQPTIAMPLDTPAVQAAFSIFDNLLS